MSIYIYEDKECNELLGFFKKNVSNIPTLIKELPSKFTINKKEYAVKWEPIANKSAVMSNLIIHKEKGMYGTYLQSIIVISVDFKNNILTMTQRISNIVDSKQVQFKEIEYWNKSNGKFENSADLLDKLKTSLSSTEAKLTKLITMLKYNESYSLLERYYRMKYNYND